MQCPDCGKVIRTTRQNKRNANGATKVAVKSQKEAAKTKHRESDDDVTQLSCMQQIMNELREMKESLLGIQESQREMKELQLEIKESQLETAAAAQQLLLEGKGQPMLVQICTLANPLKKLHEIDFVACSDASRNESNLIET